MKQTDQKGFGIIEVLLLIIAIALIVGVGFYVVNANKDKTESATTSNTSKQSSGKDNNKPEVAKDDRQTGDFKELPFTFKYTKDWKSTVQTDDASPDIYNLLLSTQNVKKSESEYPSVVSGAEVKIYADKKNAPTALDGELSKMFQKEGTVKNVVVDETPAIEYTWAYEGPSQHEVKFIYDDATYSISMESDVYSKSEYKAVFDDLIKSIKFR